MQIILKVLWMSWEINFREQSTQKSAKKIHTPVTEPIARKSPFKDQHLADCSPSNIVNFRMSSTSLARSIQKSLCKHPKANLIPLDWIAYIWRFHSCSTNLHQRCDVTTDNGKMKQFCFCLRHKGWKILNRNDDIEILEIWELMNEKAIMMHAEFKAVVG